MGFPKSRIISAKRLSQLMKESSESGERFCFILGSGASVESGIPSGSTLEMQWMDCLMGKMSDRGMPAMDVDETRNIAEALYAENAVGHELKEIEEAWLRAKKENRPMASQYYFDIYKLRFHGNPRQGYNYLEKIMENCDPSLGYHTLAKLLTENNLHNLVITTNFDSLVEDALFLYTDKKPLVVSHESLADYIEANIRRPIVAKVHRGLMYAPFNSPETTQELKPEWQNALNYALNTYTPIVIGYAGGDHSLMSFLEKDTTAIRNGVYWCYRGKGDPCDLPEENIQEFVRKRNGYFVAIEGFDALMVEIGKTMYRDAIRPGLTEEKLKKKHDDRVRRYYEQWDELNEKQEMKETLQEMNEAEQQEAEQREKEETPTAQDYFRRGLRASKEGRCEDAVKEYSKAIEMDPNYKAAYNNRGNMYRNLGNYEGALADYKKAIELDSNYVYGYISRGNVYGDLGRKEEALADFNKAIEINSNFEHAYNGRGNVYRDLGRKEEALRDYNKAIEINPNFEYAYNGRGNVYRDLGRKEEALEDYNKAIEINPNFEHAYNNRGTVYRELGQNEEALKDYEKALQLNPEYKTAYLNRVRTYSALGQETLAEADRKTAAEL